MSVARSYARALYEAAAQESTRNTEFLDQLETQLSALIEAFWASPAGLAGLTSPLTSLKEKNALIDGVCVASKASPLLTRFFHLLANKRRLGLLPEIRDAFLAVRLLAEGGVSGELVAADSLNEQDVEGLSRAFSKRLGRKVMFKVSTDPTLLAGIKISVGGVTYDGTLRSQLRRLRDRFVSGMAGN